MARTALTVGKIGRSAPLTFAPTAANADGHSFANDGNNLTFLYVKNASGGSINVTFPTPATADGLAVSDLVVAVPNNGERMIGPFPKAYYNQSDDTVHVDFSGVSSVTCQAIKLGS